MRERATSLPSTSRTTISDSTERCFSSVGKLWPAPSFLTVTIAVFPSTRASYSKARFTCASLREPGKTCTWTSRRGPPTAIGRSTVFMWQSMHTRPVALPVGAFSHW
jgi:hypothetical protein